MAQSITVDFHDLASVKVTKYIAEPNLSQVTMRFRVYSVKTRSHQEYTAVVPTVVPNPDSIETIAIGWRQTWTYNRLNMLDFIESEQKTPTSLTGYQVPFTFLPEWQTPEQLNDFATSFGVNTTLMATLTTSYEFLGGALPTGVNFDESTGGLSGFPTDHGNFTFTVRAVGSNPSLFNDRTFTTRIFAPPVWTTLLLPDWVINVENSQQFLADGAGSYHLETNTLPQGLSFLATGLLTGTATETGTFTFTIRALTLGGVFGLHIDREFTLTVI